MFFFFLLQLDIHKNYLPLVMSGITLVVGEVPKTMGAEEVGRPVLELVDVALTGEVVHTKVSDVAVTVTVVVVVGTVPVLEHAAVMGVVVGSVTFEDSVGKPSLSTAALDSWCSQK